MRSVPFCIFALLVTGVLPAASREPESDNNRAFKRMEVHIAMRDGVKLYTDIYIPKKSRERLPFLITRTPYGSTDDKGRNNMLEGSYKDFVKDGYVFVFQDIRGRYKSEGQFVMFRPPRDKSDPKAIDESTDTSDTIEWLLKNVPENNGRAGILGISYGGWLTSMALLDPHPALKAASEQASPADQFLGDDFHHNGAFRLSYGVEYSAMMETGNTNFNFQFDKHDTYEWYLALGALSNFDRNYAHGKIPTWTAFVDHPNYDEFWQKQAVTPYLDTPKVPNLNVAGWWDQEDFYGPIDIYRTLEKYDTKHLNYLVVGPWNHGGWSGGVGDRLGPITFGAATAEYFREKVQAPWFAYFLKDKGQLDLPEALTFEAGSNTWRRWDAWPPGSKWPTWLVEDQRFVHDRADVLSWESEPLNAEVSIAGEVSAHLFASTTGSDADWIVKLIDVYPEQNPENWDLAGYELMVSNEVFRGRYRNGFEKPQAITPKNVLEYTFSLHTQNYTFLKGHRLMVQVQSTWFPLIDRNPQTFVSNIFQATAADFAPATHTIHRSARYPSHVAIPVVVPQEKR